MDRGDSISVLLQKVKTDHLTNAQKGILLQKAFRLSETTVDSVALEHLNTIAYQAYKSHDSALFFASGHKAYTFAVQLQDTAKIADMHWNYGAYYLRQLSYDSSYYHYQKARKLFHETENTFYAARMLYNMAFILSRLRDYTGAEVYLFQAIEIFKPLNKHKQLYLCYNLLGVIYEELEDYDKSLSYHQMALDYLDKLEDKSLFLQDSYNNMGLIYQKQGNQNQAIAYFEKALKITDLRAIDPFLYARLIDNKAFSRFLNNDTSDLPKAFFEALHIRDSMHNISGVIMSRAHLAVYYAKQKDTAMALDHAKKAYKLSQHIKNNRDILRSLELLSRLDTKGKDKYLEQYIIINKLVQAQERNTRNKFTRIQYETDQYIARNKQLSSRVTWTFIGGLVSFLLIFLAYLIYRQKSQNKLLQFETNQQRANEQIYRLTLQQQDKLQQGRNQERIRISEDLHDSILSDLFALRMGWNYLELKGEDTAIKKHQFYLEELQGIEKKIRELSHELKNNMMEYPIDFIFIVESLVSKRSKIGKFEYQLRHDGNIPWEQIDNLIKVNLYHIIEEALQNCIKHAQASSFILQFLWYGNNLTLEMTDNGIGTRGKRGSGIGLKNIHSRTKKMNGTYALKSTQGKGTKITINIPIIPEKS
ncbi:tetratricopeptide repeat-containing sensor histidine kinase [Confluentibacter flavum]|nr:tetratricopeptide repeat-containing sensor histidine kinase [Confluentibacter flavum]